eukprot:Blabericola_migrator_1__7749@NODE_395_length_8977_cov_183_416835_g72_i1_p4_GENE_NODE_395_length_8977_cov_183_416835_g72_i1NODE_395_length_8977_cov_183_416835_g72_i1_p4_ORF_typecomplete_len278_score34_76RNase_H/PF00075_24/2_1e47RVT_3/PF13456_6/3_4e03RVT_3/PF13456_6/6_4e09DUF3275/PF11679_8/0_0011Cauli_VI/PF01693_16/0_13Cauli_VI/PF01693_16/9e03_NODE_395_length_8977_cov_183_416835_g72_i162607093
MQAPKRRRLEPTPTQTKPQAFYLVTSCPSYTAPVVFTNWKDCEKVVKREQGHFIDGIGMKKYISYEELEVALRAALAEHAAKADQSPRHEAVKHDTVKPEPITPIRVIDPKVTTMKQASSSNASTATSNNGKTTHIYTDGACSANGKKNAKAGWGVWFGPNDSRNRCGSTVPATNQRAELEAIREALKLSENYPEVLIHSDSQYAMKCVNEWIKNWKRNGWKNASGQPVCNQDLITQIDALLMKRGKAVKFVWVRGHSGDPGNDAADALARRGIGCG